MAAIHSLGLHRPSALEHLVAEGILPPNPDPQSYTWEVIAHDGPEEELLIAGTCVAWSQGRVLRKVFNLSIEHQKIQHAKLAWFPDELDQPAESLNSSTSVLPAQQKTSTDDHDIRPSSTTPPSAAKTRALVIFLKHQAHVFFLSGASHVVNLPFEVERVFAAPRGLILQRKLADRSISVLSSHSAPVAPQNSLFFSQIQAAAGEMTSKQGLFPSTTGSGLDFDLLHTPHTTIDSGLPRHYLFSNPMAEMALVVQPMTFDHLRSSSHAKMVLEPLDLDEEIIYISDADETKMLEEVDKTSVYFVVTVNWKKKVYTLWNASYVKPKPVSKFISDLNAPANGTGFRRRSSFLTTGTATPVMKGRESVRESMGVARNQAAGEEKPKNTTTRRASRKSGVAKIEDPSLATQVDSEFERRNTARDSRRVSSMISRADLGASFDRNTFQDLATQSGILPALRQSTRRGKSLGATDRQSFGGGIHRRLRASTPGTFSELSIEDVIGAGISHGRVSFSQTSATIEDVDPYSHHGQENFGQEKLVSQNPLHGLQKEFVVRSFADIPMLVTSANGHRQIDPAMQSHKDLPVVFTLTSPLNFDESLGYGRRFFIVILDKASQELIQVEVSFLPKNLHSNSNSFRSHAFALPSSRAVTRIQKVFDALVLKCSAHDKAVLLKQDESADPGLFYYSPWSSQSFIKVANRRLRIFNPHDVQQAQTTPRKVGSKRTISLTDRISGIRHGGFRQAIDVISLDGKNHQMRTMLWSSSHEIQRLIKLCLFALPLDIGDKFLTLWCNRNVAYQKLSHGEWDAFAVSIFCLFLSCEDERQTRLLARRQLIQDSASPRPRRERVVRLQSSWNENRNSRTASWKWATAVSPPARMESPNSGQIKDSLRSPDNPKDEDFSTGHIVAARAFILSSDASEILNSLRSQRLQLLQSLSSLITLLHCFREDAKISDLRSQCSSIDSQVLAPVISQLARWLGWHRWDWKHPNYYALESIDGRYLFEDATMIKENKPCRAMFDAPPSVNHWLEMMMTVPGTPSFPSLSNLFSSRDKSWFKNLDLEIFPRISSLNAFHSHIIAGHGSPVDYVQASLQTGLTRRVLESFSNVVSIILQEMIAQTQELPPVSWSVRMLNHISREDLTLTSDKEGQPSFPSRSNRLNYSEAIHDLHSISQSAEYLEPMNAFPSSDRIALSRLIFNQDRRLAEAIHMIEPYRVAVALCVPEPGWSDGQVLEAQREVHNWVMTRTFSLAPGLGFAHYDSRTPLLSERFNIHGYNTLCVMKPMNNTVSIDRSMFTEDKFAWAWFHSGVAAGLSIAKNAKGIDSSWIVFNRPMDLNNRHAGLLLALGLNGHLKNMAKWLAFKYLTPKHAMTSIGLLLGLSASYIGTMDTLITRLLSVHITRMLPPGAAELNLSTLTQTAGLMGVGLLYHNSQHRRMSEVMLSEIENLDVEDPSGGSESIRDESYRLAAGFALGLINLGQGADLRGLHDLRFVERLLTIAVGPKPVNVIHLIDQATAGATCALMFVFMKTNNSAVARKIDIPDTVPQFDFIRPDMLLLRTLAKHLIVWDGIQANDNWILRNLPREYARIADLEYIHSLTTEHLPFYNILAGLLWAIGLRNVGSGDVVVKDFLVRYLDQLIRISRLPAERYDSQLTRNTVRNCQDLVALACSTVMAGTGDLDVFRRLRSLHGRVNADTPYGSHMAGHMAIGVLFFGAGSYTFGTTNLAIASLVVAFYPVFPMDVSDNKAHLQAFRHLWTLAAEPRCLVVQDIDSRRNIALEVLLHLRNGSTQRVTAPILLPDLSTISKITTISSEFWPVVLDFVQNPTHLQAFKHNQIIYVRKRSPHEAHTSTFTATLLAINGARSSKTDTSDWIFKLSAFGQFEASDTSIFVNTEERSSVSLDMRSSAIDARLTLGRIAEKSWNTDELWSLRTLFKWADRRAMNGEDELKFIRKEVLDMLKAIVEKRARN